MIPRFLIFVFGLLLLSGEVGVMSVHAAEAAGGGGWLTTIGRWVNLAIVFGLIYYFVREPMSRFFAGRRNEIQQEIKEAQQARAEAERQLAQIEDKMRRLEQERAVVRQEIEEEIGSERERLLRVSRRESERILSLARREIQGLTLSARKELQEHAVNLAIDLAEKRIRESISPDLERRLMEQFFAELGGSKLR